MSMRTISIVESMEVGFYLFTWKHDMDAYMATLFGGEAWDLCWGLGWAKKKLDPTVTSLTNSLA